MTWAGCFVAFLLVCAAKAEEDPYRARDSLHPGVEGPCSSYVSTPDLEAKVQDESVCTVVLAGPSWDGHYKVFRSSNYWRDLTTELCSEEFAFVYSYYSGYQDTYQLPRIAESWQDGTLPSYEIRAFRGGHDLGRVEAIRQRLPHAEVVEELRRVCGTGAEEKAWARLRPEGDEAASLRVIAA